MPAEMIEAVSGRQARPAPFELKGWHVLAMFLAFFGTVGAVNAAMMTLAIRTMPGLDARNGYDPSQTYNREIAAARERSAQGWSGSASAALSGGAAEISVVLTDRDGVAVDGAQVAARLAHPSDRKRDRETLLRGLGAGRYAGRLDGVPAGAWYLILDARPASGLEPRHVSRRRVGLGG